MKILIRISPERVKEFYDLSALPQDWTLIWAGLERDTNKLLAMARDAEAIFVDVTEPVPADLITRMPNLKIIHSEGVGFDQIDLEAATRRGIYVCNNKGGNAKAVAEHTVMLMLALLRRTVEGDMVVRTGRQLEAKTCWMQGGLRELGGMRVGLVGMGDIGRATAKALLGFDARICYYNRTRLRPQEEKDLSLTYLPMEELLKQCDIISLHIAANPQTRNFMNWEKFSLMKKGSMLINTARGEIVNQPDLIKALEQGLIAAAGLDCFTPEPVLLDNEMLNLPAKLEYKLTYSPHIAGVTPESMKRMHKMSWENIMAVAKGRVPLNVVNREVLG